MRVENGRWQINTRDISHGHYCLAHCLHLSMAAAAEEETALDLMHQFPVQNDAKLIMEQGNDFEEAVFEDIRASLPAGEFEMVPDHAAKEQTAIALRAGIPVIAQAPVGKSFDNVDFAGRADLLVREDYEIVATVGGSFVAAKIPNAAESDKYTVWDVKHSKADSDNSDRYQMQIAMMAECIDELGHLSDKPSGLLMKLGAIVACDIKELIRKLDEYRAPTLGYLDSHPTILKGELSKFDKYCKPKGLCAQGSCDYKEMCTHFRREMDDQSFLRQWHHSHPGHFANAGLRTISDLAGMQADGIPGLKPEMAIKYISQAEAIVKSRQSGNPEYVVFAKPNSLNPVLPEISGNDLYFDFEFMQLLNSSEYHYFLGGYTDPNDSYHPFASWDLEGERDEMARMINEMVEHLSAQDDALVFHYSAAEKTGIERLGLRLGMDEQAKLIASRLFDLYSVVRQSVATSQKSQSLKSLEAFLGEGGYSKDVGDGNEAQFLFYEAQKARIAGDIAKSDAVMVDLEKYHKQDCVNTRRLHEWLLTLNA
jgi:predicted RecB family nuclease